MQAAVSCDVSFCHEPFPSGPPAPISTQSPSLLSNGLSRVNAAQQNEASVSFDVAVIIRCTYLATGRTRLRREIFAVDCVSDASGRSIIPTVVPIDQGGCSTFSKKRRTCFSAARSHILPDVRRELAGHATDCLTRSVACQSLVYPAMGAEQYARQASIA